MSIDKLVLELEASMKRENILTKALKFYENSTRLILQVRDLPIDPISGKPQCSEQHLQDNGDIARIALAKASEIK